MFIIVLNIIKQIETNQNNLNPTSLPLLRGGFEGGVLIENFTIISLYSPPW
jgi:hypothetical protein